MGYQLQIPGLDAAAPSPLAAVPVEPKHAALLKAVRRLPGLANARLVTHRGDAWLSKRSVVSAAGEPVADDHEAWLAAELARDGGHLATTLHRLRELNHQLTECAIDRLYVVQDNGGAQDNFVQLEVDVHDEVLDRRLFSSYDTTWRAGRLRDLSDLVREAEDGERLEPAQRAQYRPPVYRLARVFDAGVFLREAAAHETAKRRAAQGRRVEVSIDGAPARSMTLGELVPEQGSYLWPGSRLIADWTLSSAGRAGRRFCESWALQISDYTSPQGERSMGVIPLWTHSRKMAALARGPKSTYELFGKLESLDRRLGVPFAWYFYMLHGNLVRDWAGDRVLDAAEAGKIMLPEHDYQVLKRWQAQPYGF